MSNNFYDPHPFMIDSGTFWRCKHGNTGYDGDLGEVGCAKCAWNKGLVQWAKFYWNKWHNI